MSVSGGTLCGWEDAGICCHWFISADAGPCLVFASIPPAPTGLTSNRLSGAASPSWLQLHYSFPVAVWPSLSQTAEGAWQSDRPSLSRQHEFSFQAAAPDCLKYNLGLAVMAHHSYCALMIPHGAASRCSCHFFNIGSVESPPHPLQRCVTCSL